MQGMFGASVNELHLLIKSLINYWEGSRSMCDHKKQKKYTAYTGTVSQTWL